MGGIWSRADSDLVQVRAGGPGGDVEDWGHPILGGLSLVRWFAVAGWRVEMVDEGCPLLSDTQYWVAGPGPDLVQGLLRWLRRSSLSGDGTVKGTPDEWDPL